MRPFALLAALVLLATPASAQERVRLTFDWPVGLRGTETSTVVQSTSAAGMQQSQESVVTHAIEVVDDPQGLLIRYREGKLVQSDQSGPAGMGQMEDFTRLIYESPFDVLVDEAGRLLTVRRDSLTRANLRAALDEVIAPVRDVPGAEGMVDMLDGMVSDDALNSQVGQSWSSAVGFYAGDELVVGQTSVSQEEGPMPMMENRTLLLDMETTIEGRVPCVEGGAPDACVKVVVRSRADPEDLRSMVDEMMGSMLGGLPEGMDMEFGAFEQESLIESVVQPETLIPFSVTMTSTADVEMVMMGQSMATRQDMTVTTIYDWENR